ncbi:MAG: hypothetical protein GOP50_10365 [Candidatus Heimdallarchaeota archaeon]|nr:hypothetical protein [Candidatus Heimdallarchaeota archaeon]
MRKLLFVMWSANKGTFTHVMMNVLDFHEKGYGVGVVFESEGCKLIPSYEENMNDKFEKMKQLKLIFSVCKVCAKATGALESAEKQGLPIHDELFGHTPLELWVKEGYEIISV